MTVLLAAEKGGGGNFLVSPELGLMIWALLAFGITLFLLNKLAFPRIAEALDRRRRAIEESIEAAQRAKQEADELLGEYRHVGSELDIAADAVLTRAVRGAWTAGWAPTDLQELARRVLEPTAAGLLLEHIVVESRTYAGATLHPRWRAALDAVAAGVGHEITDGPRLRSWVARTGDGRVEVLAALLRVLTIGWLAGRLTGRRLGVLVVREGPAAFEPLADRCVAGEVEVHIDRTFGLDDVAQALTHVGEGRALGKVVVEVR